jgi:hypothetical protein
MKGYKMARNKNNFTIFTSDEEGIYSEEAFPTLKEAMSKLKKETFYALGEDHWIEYFNHSSGKWCKLEVIRKGEILGVEKEIKGQRKENPSSWKEIITEIS